MTDLEGVEIGGGGDAKLTQTTEPCHPLDLLVEDVWLKILSFVDPNPRDLLNVGETHSYFRDLLESEKPGGRGAGYNACRFEEVLPLVIQYMGTRRIHDVFALRMRQVCKRVCDTMDKILENMEMVTPRENLGLFPWLLPPTSPDLENRESYEWKHFRLRTKIIKWYWPSIVFNGGKCFKPLEKLQSYQEFLEEECKNRRRTRTLRPYRMVGKKVSVICPSILSFQQPPDLSHATFVDKMLEFFEATKFAHIQSLNMETYQMTVLKYFNLLGKLLSLLPHLRSLDFAYITARGTLPYSDEELEELDHFMEIYPLPVAPKLHRLLLFYMPRLPPSFVLNVADAYGSHLKILRLLVTDPSMLWSRPVRNRSPPFNFPLLEELHVKLLATSLPLLLRFQCPRLLLMNIWIARGCPESRDMEPLVELSEAIANFPSVANLELDYNLDMPEPSIQWWNPVQLLGRRRHWEYEQLNVRRLEVETDSLRFQTRPSLRCYTRMFPNVEEISIIDMQSWNWNDKERKSPERDPDLVLLKAGHLRESPIWREAAHLQVVSELTMVRGCTSHYKSFYKCARP